MSTTFTAGVTAIILTFDSEDTVEEVILSCRSLVSRVLVVDSYSTDATVAKARDLGAEVVQHEFVNYSEQRRWAQAHAQLRPEDWVLHLDSDEVVSEELAESIRRALLEPPADVDGFLVRRLSYFLGHPIRYGHINPSWHLRLYKAGKGYCERRLYDQHFVVPGKTQRLKGPLYDLQTVTIERWTATHNRWSTAEAAEALQQMEEGRAGGDETLPASLFGDIRMQKRWFKNHVWYNMPLLLRGCLFFPYSYILRLGFLDGKVGFVYHVLQAFWFRFLIDAKMLEMQITRDREGRPTRDWQSGKAETAATK